MSKTKVSKTLSSTGKKKKKEWPVVVYFWTFGLGARIHPLEHGACAPAPLVSLGNGYYCWAGWYDNRLDLVSLARGYYLRMEER